MAGSRQLPELGRRGEGWVVVQFVLVAAILLSALVGRGWTNGVAFAAFAVGGALLVLGSILLVAGALRLGRTLTPLPAPRPGRELTTAGVYGLARHPMYGGGILFSLGWSIVFGSIVGLVLTMVLVVFVELKSRREELWLAERHPDYADYRRRTPRRFIPFLY